jgi:hypothetical protein
VEKGKINSAAMHVAGKITPGSGDPKSMDAIRGKVRAD